LLRLSVHPCRIETPLGRQQSRPSQAAASALIANGRFTSIRDVDQTSQMRKYRSIGDGCRTGNSTPLLPFEKLERGDEFQCSVSFRRSGAVQVQVRVSDKAPAD
jgi:hypothetical protein